MQIRQKKFDKPIDKIGNRWYDSYNLVNKYVLWDNTGRLQVRTPVSIIISAAGAPNEVIKKREDKRAPVRIFRALERRRLAGNFAMANKNIDLRLYSFM